MAITYSIFYVGQCNKFIEIHPNKPNYCKITWEMWEKMMLDHPICDLWHGPEDAYLALTAQGQWDLVIALLHGGGIGCGATEYLKEEYYSPSDPLTWEEFETLLVYFYNDIVENCKR